LLKDIHPQGTATREETTSQEQHIRKYKETYYERTSGKHVKTVPKKEEWERLNKNGALDFYI
jgi:hypothetical protein